MKRFITAIFTLCTLASCTSSQEQALARFETKFMKQTNQSDLNSLRERLAEVNEDITTKGILHDPVIDEYLLTGYDYGQFYDWDLYFENIYQMYIGESKYCFKNLEGFFARQEPSGFIKRAFGTKDFGANHMFKPFVAQTVLLGMRQSDDKEWLTKYYDNISRYLDFWHSEYDKDGNGLCVWYNSDHSGMDNQHSRVIGEWKGDNVLLDEGVDLNSYLYREHQAMAELSQMIGKSEQAKRHLEKAEQIKEAINRYLWDEKDGIYYDRLETTGELNRVKGVSAFAPMYAGVASKNQAERLVKEHLTNPDEFWAEYPIHTLAKSEKEYQQVGCQPPQTFCNWNGTTWIPFNYMVFHGLMDYGYTELAEELAYKTFDLVFQQNDVTREYYNSETGVGYGRKPFFGWSTLAYLMPLEFEMNYNPTAIKEVEMPKLVELIGTKKIAHKDPYTTDWESLKQHKATPDWFADAKLGVYYHWGVYSVPGWNTEWYPRWMYVPDREVGFGAHVYEYHLENYGADVDYHDFIEMWEAPKFSAKEWCDMFEDLGAKFIGTIAEHHDGFSMWDSEVNPWNVADMGPKIDVMKQMAEEVQSRDLKFMATFHHGFHHMYYPKNKEGYEQ